jgi:hypothetical protein
VIKRDKAISEPSIMAKAHEEEKEREAQAAVRDSRPRDRGPPRAERVEEAGLDDADAEVEAEEVAGDAAEPTDEN